MKHLSCDKHWALNCLVILSCLMIVHSRSLAAERPNIILCMGDDHGWEETGYNGHPHLKTPVLDEMAATGLRLDHFFLGTPILFAHARQCPDRRLCANP